MKIMIADMSPMSHKSINSGLHQTLKDTRTRFSLRSCKGNMILVTSWSRSMVNFDFYLLELRETNFYCLKPHFVEICSAVTGINPTLFPGGWPFLYWISIWYFAPSLWRHRFCFSSSQPRKDKPVSQYSIGLEGELSGVSRWELSLAQRSIKHWKLT